MAIDQDSIGSAPNEQTAFFYVTIARSRDSLH